MRRRSMTRSVTRANSVVFCDGLQIARRERRAPGVAASDEDRARRRRARGMWAASRLSSRLRARSSHGVAPAVVDSSFQQFIGSPVEIRARELRAAQRPGDPHVQVAADESGEHHHDHRPVRGGRTMPLNLNEVWKVTSTGPTMPQNRCTSSQVFMLPASSPT